jgi:hypothetical protein
MEKRIEIEGIDFSTYAGKAAQACKTKVRGIMGDDLLTFTLMDFVNILLINNKFMSKGIFFTDDNKEEGYIKIIESGDESLINDLEKFIQLKENVKKIERYKDEYYDIIVKLQSLTDPNDKESVNLIVENYLRR